MLAIQMIDTGQPEKAGREPDWHALALCRDGGSYLTAIFFSEQIDDINAAKAFCLDCDVQGACLAWALSRREPWGVWGGELFVNGKVLAQKKKRGRPRKIRPEEPAARSA